MVLILFILRILEVRVVFAQLLCRPKRVYTMELRVRRRDEMWRVLEASAANVIGDRRVRGIVIVCRDITTRKQAEIDLRQAYNDAKRRARRIRESWNGQRRTCGDRYDIANRPRLRYEIAKLELLELRRMKQELEAQEPQASNLALELRGVISVIRLRLEPVLAHPEHLDWANWGFLFWRKPDGRISSLMSH